MFGIIEPVSMHPKREDVEVGKRMGMREKLAGLIVGYRSLSVVVRLSSAVVQLSSARLSRH